MPCTPAGATRSPACGRAPTDVTAALAFLLLQVAPSGGRAPALPRGPIALLTATSTRARAGVVSVAGDPRLALLESASFDVTVPAHAVLTFAVGIAGVGADPSWTYSARVVEGGNVLADVNVWPGAEWRNVTVPLGGPSRRARLAFALEVGDGRGAVKPSPSVSFGIAEPTVHDPKDYGRAKTILVVSIDTLRRDHVGAYGYAKPTTPRLDALAARGVRCDDAVSTSSWTLPAHLSMLTSVDPAAHGGVDRDHGFARAVPTLPETLRKAGFATQAVTSHLYVSATYGVDAGFDRLDFRQDRPADEVAERAADVLDRFGDRPLFLFLHFYDPHWNYLPHPQTERLFPSPPGRVSGFYREFSTRTRANTSADDLARLLALYDGEIRYTDDAIGRVLDHARAIGADRSLLVLVASDHGEEFLEHASWEHQKTLYEEVVRVPLIVAGPRVPQRLEREQASLVDLAPTVLAWAGLPVPSSMQGRSLLAPLPPREAYGETDHVPDGTRKLFLRDGGSGHKLVLSLDRKTDAIRGVEWFDLAADPREQSPSSEAPSEVQRRALERWRAARAKGAAAPKVELSPEQIERLKALGYVGP